MSRDEYVQMASEILKEIHDNLDDDKSDYLEGRLIALEDEIMSVYGNHHEMTKILV